MRLNFVYKIRDILGTFIGLVACVVAITSPVWIIISFAIVASSDAPSVGKSNIEVRTVILYNNNGDEIRRVYTNPMWIDEFNFSGGIEISKPRYTIVHSGAYSILHGTIRRR